MAELKPCPFCGKPVYIYESMNAWFVDHVDRSDCILIFPAILHGAETENEAIVRWNRRADNG